MSWKKWVGAAIYWILGGALAVLFGGAILGAAVLLIAILVTEFVKTITAFGVMALALGALYGVIRLVEVAECWKNEEEWKSESEWDSE